MVFDKPNIASDIEKYAEIYDKNALNYYLQGKNKGYDDICPKAFLDALLGVIAYNIDPVIRDYKLAEEGFVALDPPYAAGKLGLISKKIKNIEDVYGSLCVECSHVIPMLPKFKSIKDVLDFKERKRNQIGTL